MFLVECDIDQLYAKHYFLLNCTAMFTIARFVVLLVTQRKVFVEHTTLIDKCKHRRDAHTCCRAIGSGVFTGCFSKMGLSLLMHKQ